MAGVADRLPRLLALVPYLLARPGVPIDEAAADFGITTRQLRRDLELLWMCGLPGYGPGDLIDLSFEGDSVTVMFDAGMNRPLRLTGAEATALVVALRALADTPGIADDAAVRRALAKIETAAGGADGVVVGLGERTGEPAVRDAVQDAVHRRRALRIRYFTASRDAVSDRVVDPMRLLLVEGRGYLEAWCRSAGAVRMFRIDRVDVADVLDEPATPPATARQTDTSAGLFETRPDQLVAVLIVQANARWIGEYYPVDDVTELADGAARIRMRYADEPWMVRLVLGLGADADVQDPPELALAVRQRARAALRRSVHLPVTTTG